MVKKKFKEPLRLYFTGSLFLFRDSPQRLVEVIAEEYIKDDEDWNNLVDLAREELRTRKILNDKENNQ